MHGVKTSSSAWHLQSRGFVPFPPPRSFIFSAGSNAYVCADIAYSMHMHMVSRWGQSMWGPISHYQELGFLMFWAILSTFSVLDFYFLFTT